MSTKDIAYNIINSLSEEQLNAFVKLFGDIALDVPNADTMAAMDEFEQMKAHPENYKRYASFSEVINEVISDA